jgi:hypothetical protein
MMEGLVNDINLLKASNFQLRRVQEFVLKMTGITVLKRAVENLEKVETQTDSNASDSEQSSSEELDDGSGDWRQEGVKKKKKSKNEKR